MKPDEFVTADIHFGHKMMIDPDKGGRPFATIDVMDGELIRRFNAKVPRNARVYIIGDVSFRPRRRTKEILDELHGRKCLIMGNHDRGMIKGYLAECFEWIKDYYEMHLDNEDKTRVCMFHFPILSWHHVHKGAWHLHGHSHGNLPDTGVRRLDVGIDVHPNYEPFSFQEIAERMEGREHKPIDHH